MRFRSRKGYARLERRGVSGAAPNVPLMRQGKPMPPVTTPAPTRRRGAWRIVEYIDGDSGERHFGILHGKKRVAWALKDRRDAHGWLRRKKVALPEQLVLDGLADR